jgi:quercetin dioxygenase-like cupin family protein
MHLVRFADAPAYIARGHDGVTPRRVQGREAGGPSGVFVSISEYPPGSGGQSTTASTEVVYLVMAGSIRVRHDLGEELLGTGDSISFEPGESRAAYNDGTEPARLVVIHQPERDGS